MEYLPNLKSHTMILNNHLHSETDISRHITYHPLSETVNLGLSIKQLIEYSDDIGLTDESLSTAILVFLKKHKPDLYHILSPKKANFTLMINLISLECSLTVKLDKVKLELSKFKRMSTDTFSFAIMKFDSIYTHFSE